MIRYVKLSDAKDIVTIYNYFIRETKITFEEVELTAEQFAERIALISQKYPWFVYEKDGKVVGWAYANTWRERVAYRLSLETSVYLDPKEIGTGIGFELYDCVLNEIRERGFKQAIGGITLPNPTSEKFHEKFGFKKVAHFSNVGFKFNEWHDVGFWQLTL